MSSSDLSKQLMWQCRRGMLELDVILHPFIESHFNNLTPQQQLSFRELLKQADPDLFTWLMGYGQCDIDDLNDIIHLIRSKMHVA